MRPSVLPLVAALLVAGLPFVPGTGAQSTVAYSLYDHGDVLFSAVTLANEVELLGDNGYVAATGGGLVVWTGQGHRKVLTRTDGLPSSVVLSLALTEREILVATAMGFASVDLATLAVSPLAAPGAAGELLASPGTRVRVVDGTWYALTFRGDLAVREGSAWRAVEAAPGGERDLYRATDLAVRDGTILVPTSDQGVLRLAANGTWVPFARPNVTALTVGFFEAKVVVGTRGDGVRLYDMDGTPSELPGPPALVGQSVYAIATFGHELWLGTTAGIRIYSSTTREWRAVEFYQVPHPYVADLVPLRSKGAGAVYDEAVLATPIGVAWPHFEERAHFYEVHTTTNGPPTNTFTTASALGSQVWGGTQVGASIFHANELVWEHLGVADGLEGSPVYKVSQAGSRAWLATGKGVYGLDLDQQRWTILQDNDPALRPGNIFYDVAQDGQIVWMPELGNGLLRYRLDTNRSARYEIPDGLLSHGLTCARRWMEFLAVCTAESFQLFNLSQESEIYPIGIPYDFCHGYACESNYPANNTFTALPDGPRLWTGTVDAGVVLFERDRTQPHDPPVIVGHWTAGDGLPSEQVRALHPADGGVWVGTDKGLARLDVERGIVAIWGRGEGLDDLHINGIAQVGSTLYLATLAGLYRLDIDTGEMLPLVISDADIGRITSSVRVSYPPPGSLLRRPVNMTGTATVPGGGVDAIEVQLDTAPWVLAQGTQSWRYRLPIDALAEGPHAVRVRAIDRDRAVAWSNITIRVERAEAELSLPVVEHVPPREAVRGTPLLVTARVRGEPPLAVTLDAVLPGETVTLPGSLVGGTVSFTLPIPAEAQGDVGYRFFVQSGAGEARSPEAGYHIVPILDERIRRLAVALAEGQLELARGTMATVSGNVTNLGNRPEELRLVASGLRPSWVTASPARLFVAPGQRVGFEVMVTVPEDGAPGVTVLLLNAQALDLGVAASAPLSVNVPLEDRGGGQGRGIPLPALPLLIVAAALVASHSRRRRP